MLFRSIEDALGRLDRLTHDEVGMAAAQGLSATHKVVDKVKGVEGKLQGVGDKVQGVGDRVRDVDNKIDLVIDGVHLVLNQAAQVTQF